MLVRRHEDRIFGLALKMTGNRSDALDATQDTFVTACRRAGSWRGDAAFGTWLYRIGVNACHDLLRKRSGRELLEPDGGTEGGDSWLESRGRPDAGHDVEASVTLRLDLAHALKDLPESQREAVVMHDLGGVPYGEIASLTGVSIGTVKSRISRGRRALATLLEQPGSPQASKEK